MTITKTSKLVLLSLISAVLLLNISCTYNDNPVYSTNNTDVYNRTIRWNEWELVRNDWDQIVDGHFFKRLYISNITGAVIDNGAVLVYYRYNPSNNWIPLPYSTTYYKGNQPFAEEIWYEYGRTLGALDINYIYTEPYNMIPPDFLYLKIILVRL